MNELILLVDDEPSIIKLARMYLERENFRVELVNDGEAALELVERNRPSLVVLDVMLPKLDGFEVCRRLRASQADTAILMLTARDEDIDKFLGLELGADDYLTKPFNPRELVARVKAILRRGERKPSDETKPIYIGDLTIDPAHAKPASPPRPSTCVPRNLTFSSPLPGTAGLSSAANKFYKKPGVLISTVRRAQWMSMWRTSAKSWMEVL